MEWYHVCWPRLTAKRVEPVVSISWASCCNTCNAPYIETTDRRDFGGKPSEWRWGRVLSWKILEFCCVGGARSKTAFFRVFRLPLDYPAHSLQETVLPQTNVPMESQDSEDIMPYASLESLWPGIWHRPLKGAEKWSRDHHENWKFACRKIRWFQKCYSFRSMTKITKLLRKNRFRTVTSPGAWPSWIDARRQYIFLVVIKLRFVPIVNEPWLISTNENSRLT